MDRPEGVDCTGQEAEGTVGAQRRSQCSGAAGREGFLEETLSRTPRLSRSWLSGEVEREEQQACRQAW